MPPARATWFCIDIEANGPVPGLYDMVSLGATVVVLPDTAFLDPHEVWRAPNSF